MDIEFTVIFWNIWEAVQCGRIDDGTFLKQRLEQLIDEYDPDYFGLNEVLVDKQTGSSPVLDFFKSKGYYTHFTEFSPIHETWMIGSTLISKQKPSTVVEHPLGPDSQAQRQRNHHGFHVKAIEGRFKTNDQEITIWVNYLQSLLPSDWLPHIRQRRTFETLLAELDAKNLIVGGDFNETKYMLPWLRLPKRFKRLTGTFINPTWRLEAKRRYLVQSNYDNIIYSTDGSLRLESFKVLPRSPSDHSPLIATFKV